MHSHNHPHTHTITHTHTHTHIHVHAQVIDELQSSIHTRGEQFDKERSGLDQKQTALHAKLAKRVWEWVV
jgi:hypothetical protein